MDSTNGVSYIPRATVDAALVPQAKPVETSKVSSVAQKAINPYERQLNVLERNQLKLQTENGKTIEALEKTVKMLLEDEKALLDRIALLESEVMSERAHSAAMERMLQAERDCLKEKDGLLQDKDKELEHLRKRVEKLEDIEDTLEGLEKADWAQHWKRFSKTGGLAGLSDYSVSIRVENGQKEYGKSFRKGLPVPAYLERITDKIKAEPAEVIPGVNRSNPIPIPTRKDN